jgi:hypothetical protein
VVLTLTAASAAGAQQIEAVERPGLGDVYYIDGINREVVGFSGGGPFRVELNGPVASAHPAGTVFRSTNSHDFLHPSSQGHRLIAPVIQAWAESLTSGL